MCDGSDTNHYLSEGYNVVAVEADPELIKKARQRFRNYINSGQLTLVSAGIAQHRGVADFYVNTAYPIWNSFDEKIASRDNLPYSTIQIECVPFDEIISQYGIPYYLKVDIEGQDKFCLEALDKLDLPKYISFEADNEGNPEMLDRLYELGYRKFKCINQNNFLPIAIPYISGFTESQMSRRDVLYLRTRYSRNIFLRVFRKFKGRSMAEKLLRPSSHLRHEVGSSGPFGEETMGDWLSYEKVKSLYLSSYASYRQNEANSAYGFWCDFHASL